MAASEDIDLELIAAFMDGRLKGAERERAIKLLRDSEAAFEVYADALRARADLGEAVVIPITTPRQAWRGGWRVAVPFAAAAMLMIAILPTIQARRGRATTDGSVTSITRPLFTVGANVSTALGPRWDERDWTVYRGGGSTAVDSTTTFRLGVRATDLHIALAASDGERAARLTGEVLDLLQGVNLADAVRANYADLRDQLSRGEVTADVVSRASRAENDLDEFLGSRWFGFGKWFAAGEIASRARSTSFFAAPNTQRFLDWAIKNGSLAPGDVEVLSQVAVLADQGVAGGDFETIRQKFAELIRRHGG